MQRVKIRSRETIGQCSCATTDEYIIRKSAQYPSYPNKVMPHPRHKEITNTFLEFPNGLSITTVYRVQRYQ